MSNVVQKVLESDNPNVLLCERGTSFGYNTLITDFRGLTTMKKTDQLYSMQLILSNNQVV